MESWEAFVKTILTKRPKMQELKAGVVYSYKKLFILIVLLFALIVAFAFIYSKVEIDILKYGSLYFVLLTISIELLYMSLLLVKWKNIKFIRLLSFAFWMMAWLLSIPMLTVMEVFHINLDANSMTLQASIFVAVLYLHVGVFILFPMPKIFYAVNAFTKLWIEWNYIDIYSMNAFFFLASYKILADSIMLILYFVLGFSKKESILYCKRNLYKIKNKTQLLLFVGLFFSIVFWSDYWNALDFTIQLDTSKLVNVLTIFTIIMMYLDKSKEWMPTNYKNEMEN